MSTKQHKGPGRLRLGFGCASLGSAIGYKASCSLLEIAYEAGFRHYDVAPPYGNGMAERIVGDVLRTVRDQVSIVTKVGIAHPRSEGLFRTVRRLALPAKRLAPALWASASKRARLAVSPRGSFRAEEIAASFAESLRRLGMARVDALLLHAASAEGLGDDGVRALERIKSAGQAVQIGIATSVQDSVGFLQAFPDQFEIVQTEHYWGAFDPRLCGAHALVTHRCIQAGLRVIDSQPFGELLARDSSHAELKALLADPDARVPLLLAAALERNSTGTVLVSSTQPDRVREFARCEQSAEFASAAVVLNRCIEQLSPSTADAAIGRHPA